MGLSIMPFALPLFIITILLPIVKIERSPIYIRRLRAGSRFLFLFLF